MSTSTPTARLRREVEGELICWRASNAHGELRIAEQGAQVLSYGTPGARPLIWLSEQAAFNAGQSLRGGVPVCWPWFGDLARNPQAVQALHPQPSAAPFHGLARTRLWQLEDARLDGGQISLAFALPEPEAPLPGWPTGLSARLELRLDEALEISLVSRNRSGQALTISQALHTYFAVSAIDQVRVAGLDGCRYIETLEDWRECRQQGPLGFAGETDRIYLDTPTRLDIEDRPWQRRICLEATGSRSAIVWNPWIDKARRLSQFADDAWQRMLCIETANVMDDVVELAPDSETRLGMKVWSSALNS